MNEILTVVMLTLLGIILLAITILVLGYFTILMREAYIDLAHEWKKRGVKRIKMDVI